MSGAWGAGLATFAGDRILEVFYPDPQLGEHEGGFKELSAEEAKRTASRARSAPTTCRGVREAAVLTVIEDLAAPPDGAADAYLRLHLLSHRLVKPRGAQHRRDLRRAQQRRLDQRRPGRRRRAPGGPAPLPRRRRPLQVFASTSSRA